MYKTKIVVVGPPESGKTIISNFLSEATASSGAEYHPTQGARILEFESDGVIDLDNGKALKVEIELWDCAGSKRFEPCWPAFCKNVHGVLIVVRPEKMMELERWYSYFVKHQDFKDSQCLILVLSKDKSPPMELPKSSAMAAVQCVHATLGDLEVLRSEFSNFLNTICSTSKEAQDRVEQEVMNRNS